MNRNALVPGEFTVCKTGDGAYYQRVAYIAVKAPQLCGNGTNVGQAAAFDKGNLTVCSSYPLQ